MRGADVDDRSLDWTSGAGPDADIVVTSRARLARNLQGYPFPQRAAEDDLERVLETVRAALDTVISEGDVSIAEVEELAPVERRRLHERHLVGREFATAKQGRRHSALAMWTDGSAGLLVNEEDHLRLHAIRSGFDIEDAWLAVDRLDERLGSLLAFAFHHEYGFLTACPTNVGTGLRASVLVHLPGLVLTKEIRKVLEGIGQVGLTYRGLYGEGSEVVGNLFQVSNQTTLGKQEDELIAHLGRVVKKVVDYERSARSMMLREAPGVLEDKVGRAYGILRYAQSLSTAEMMNLLSALRLGVSLKLLKSPRVQTLNEILVFGQMAHLEAAAGRALSGSEADASRAAYVRTRLESDES